MSRDYHAAVYSGDADAALVLAAELDRLEHQADRRAETEG